jgi:hypothetical protein
MTVLPKGLFWAHGLSLAGPLEKASVKELPSCIAVVYSAMAKRNPLFQMGLHLLEHVAKRNPLLQMGLHLLEHVPPPIAPISLSLCKRGDFQCCEVLPFKKKPPVLVLTL